MYLWPFGELSEKVEGKGFPLSCSSPLFHMEHLEPERCFSLLFLSLSPNFPITAHTVAAWLV